jgi:hypothetical protein
MSAIWASIAEQVQPALLGGTLHRVVESQSEVATLGLVGGDLAAQDLLERMLEVSKPPLRVDTENLDYLLKTPWRYPPLAYGSRFGSRHEPSLFYGSRQATTALAETAFYRLRFLHDRDNPPPVVITRHTLFEARFRTQRGLRLHAPPFQRWQKSLTHPSNYTAAQALGTAMRNADIGAFEFTSARDPKHGLNVALLTPQALVSQRPRRPQDWLCTTEQKRVTFRSTRTASEVITFEIEAFMVDGVLPQLA